MSKEFCNFARSYCVATVRVRRVDWLATQDRYVLPADILPRADRRFDWCDRIFNLCWLADQTKYASAGARRGTILRWDN